MKPDPWQKEKSRKYQAKHKAKVESKEKAGKTTKPSSSQKGKQVVTEKTPRSDGFKFVQPVASGIIAKVEQSEGSDSDDEYDVTRIDEDISLAIESIDLNTIDPDDDLDLVHDLHEYPSNVHRSIGRIY